MDEINNYTLIDSTGKTYKSTTPGQFGGHKKLKIYGRLDCPSALRYIAKGQYVQHRIFFVDEKTAIEAGYRPCGVCMKKEYKKWKEDQVKDKVRYFMLLQVGGYDWGKSRIYYCTSLKGLQSSLEKFFNSIIDGYDWHWNDGDDKIDDNDVEKIDYPEDMPLNRWIKKKNEQINEFICYMDGAGVSLDVYSTDADVEIPISNLLDYFNINLNDERNYGEDGQNKVKTLKELLEQDKCKKAVSQINKWLAL
jgi:hypothetical protein